MFPLLPAILNRQSLDRYVVVVAAALATAFVVAFVLHKE
jgi:hypothetical protein